MLKRALSLTRRPGSGGAGCGGRPRLEAPSSLEAAWQSHSRVGAAEPQPRRCRRAAAPEPFRGATPDAGADLGPLSSRHGRVARVSSMLRKLKGEGEVSVPFDPKLWSKEGCHNRRYMLPGIACSVSPPTCL
jgi:hypothetical protein